jgi:hypothetical protein
MLSPFPNEPGLALAYSKLTITIDPNSILPVYVRYALLLILHYLADPSGVRCGFNDPVYPARTSPLSMFRALLRLAVRSSNVDFKPALDKVVSISPRKTMTNIEVMVKANS